jgi:hypothetical protein
MKNADKPAFPIPSRNKEVDGSLGLTKREYFAAMAMQGILSGNDTISIENGLFINEAKICIAIADELLKQLEQ